MYSTTSSQPKQKRQFKVYLFGAFAVVVQLLLLMGAGYAILNADKNSSTQATDTPEESAITFSANATDQEKSLIAKTIVEHDPSANLNDITVDIHIDAVHFGDPILDVYVPVTAFGSVAQTLEDSSAGQQIAISDAIDASIHQDIASALFIDASRLVAMPESLEYEQLAIIPVSELDTSYQLLTMEGAYYLDSFEQGALFRTITFDEASTDRYDTLSYSDNELGPSNVYKVNMSGVTALTRELQKKLVATGGDPLLFSRDIGEFLADADLTHVSNEVSFTEPCPYSFTAFCSPPAFIETLKDSGVDLVELTGNHNNDLGRDKNTATIELYESLGWSIVGGGRNLEEARKPHIVDEKNSQIAFLAYNYPDSPGGLAIATADSAGANPFDFSYESIKEDLQLAKESASFVIVNVQYWECYAYPDGYIEYPTCDVPIGEQETVFKELINLGADMVIGSSAHQPQTYELYNGKPIYYGLGNTYFEQTQWPGTERGLVLSHYFNGGNLLQTKITPTVYKNDFIPRIMTAEETEFLLNRLKQAR